MSRPAPRVDLADLDELQARADTLAPSVFHALAVRVLLLVVRELRLLRAGVRP